MLLREAREWHEQDEMSIGTGGEEGLEAMTRALTNHPVAWWEMRKQWQKRRGGGAAVTQNLGGGGGGGGGTSSAARGGGVGGGLASGGGAGGTGEGGGGGGGRGGGVGGGAPSYDRGGGGCDDDDDDRGGDHATTDWGACAHPVMREDPAGIGYDPSAFRQSPYHATGGVGFGGVGPNSNNEATSSSSSPGGGGNRRRGRRGPTVIYATRDVVQKRQLLQGLYVIASVCVVILFMFLLGQRKLSNYAMVGSPLSMSAYLAGEELMTAGSDGGGSGSGSGVADGGGGGGGYYDYGAGMEQGGGGQAASAAFAGFGDIEVNPIDPLANEVLANDPLVGNHNMKEPSGAAAGAAAAGARFEQLKRVVVSRSITPESTFADPSTAQYRALDWLANDDVLRYEPDSERWSRKIVQRYTLATVYYATNGQGWKNTLFFLSNRDECDWNRVYMGYFSGAGKCNKEGYVTVLALWGNFLKGGE